jgi:hypothetical protein
MLRYAYDLFVTNSALNWNHFANTSNKKRNKGQ